MLSEINQTKRFLGAKFGYGEPIPDGVYAIPTEISKGPAFMKMEMKNGEFSGEGNFHLFWDEELTVDWYTCDNPSFFRESNFSKAFRKLESCDK